MSIRVLRLGSPRSSGEGLRLGTVRRPPRGVPKSEIATRDFYDIWLPILAPSVELLGLGQQADDERSWRKFERKFRAEMKQTDAARVLDLLAGLSRHVSFSLGCYCQSEERCHRSILTQLLAVRGAQLIQLT